MTLALYIQMREGHDALKTFLFRSGSDSVVVTTSAARLFIPHKQTVEERSQTIITGA